MSVFYEFWNANSRATDTHSVSVPFWMGNMTPDKQTKLIRKYLDAYNAFDIERMLADVHPDVVFKNVSGGEINVETRGVEELRTLAHQSSALFAQRRQTATSFTHDGDTVTVEIDFEAVVAADLPSGMRAGDTIRMQGRTEFVFAGDKLIAITDYS